MAEGYQNVDSMPHGRGRYTGNYPIYKRESDETAVADTGRIISEIVNNFAQSYYAPLRQTLEGIKLGLVDPNEALVQGTRGGNLFRKYFGVQAPPPRQAEMAQTAMYPTIPQDESELGGGPGAPATQEEFTGGMPIQRPTGRVTGGFTPRTLEQLQRHVISERTAGREVPRELLAMSGLIKSVAQQEVLDPGIRERLARIKASPAMYRAYTYAKATNPTADVDTLMDFAEASGGSREAATKIDLGKGLGETRDQLKFTNAKEIKAASDAAKHGTWEMRAKSVEKIAGMKVDAQDRRTQAQKDIALSRHYTQLVDHLTKSVGLYNAEIVANEMIYGERDWDNVPDAIRDEAHNAMKLQQDYTRAKTASARTSAGTRQEALDLKRIELEQRGVALEENIKRRAMQQHHKAFYDDIKADISALALMARDPSQRQTVAVNGRRLLENKLGEDVEEPESVFALLGHVARAVGVPMGEQPSQTRPAFSSPAPKKGFNPPSVTVPKPSTPKGAPVPTKLSPQAQEFLRKYSVAPGVKR